jgi:hypothetical protein
MKQDKPTIHLDVASERKVLISGQDLNVEWLDSFILVWSGRDHPFKGVRVSTKEKGVLKK